MVEYTQYTNAYCWNEFSTRTQWILAIAGSAIPLIRPWPKISWCIPEFTGWSWHHDHLFWDEFIVVISPHTSPPRSPRNSHRVEASLQALPPQKKLRPLLCDLEVGTLGTQTSGWMGGWGDLGEGENNGRTRLKGSNDSNADIIGWLYDGDNIKTCTVQPIIWIGFVQNAGPRLVAIQSWRNWEGQQWSRTHCLHGRWWRDHSGYLVYQSNAEIHLMKHWECLNQ